MNKKFPQSKHSNYSCYNSNWENGYTRHLGPVNEYGSRNWLRGWSTVSLYVLLRGWRTWCHKYKYNFVWYVKKGLGGQGWKEHFQFIQDCQCRRSEQVRSRKPLSCCSGGLYKNVPIRSHSVPVQTYVTWPEEQVESSILPASACTTSQQSTETSREIWILDKARTLLMRSHLERGSLLYSPPVFK